MTLNNLWETIKDNPGWITLIVILLCSLIEVSKIKINPWSAIGRVVGKFLGVKAVSDKVDAVEKKVDTLEQKVNEIQNNVDNLETKVNTLDNKVDNLENKVDEIDKKSDEKDVVTSRVRILRFGSELEANIYHSKDLWDQTMKDIAKYEQYVYEHPTFENGITEPTVMHIRREYQKRLEKNDWSKSNNG